MLQETRCDALTELFANHFLLLQISTAYLHCSRQSLRQQQPRQVLSIPTANCFALLVWVLFWFGFMRVCFFPPAYFNCIISYCDEKVRWERVGWKKKVRGGIFTARRKVCWNCIFILFAAVFTLAVLSRFVSVRNILRLWHTVIWNTFPLAVFQHYWDLVINTSLRKSYLSLGWKWIGKMI